MSTSKNSEGKPRAAHIVQLSLHVSHVPHLEETDNAQAPPRRRRRASAASPSPSGPAVPRAGSHHAVGVDDGLPVLLLVRLPQGLVQELLGLGQLPLHGAELRGQRDRSVPGQRRQRPHSARTAHTASVEPAQRPQNPHSARTVLAVPAQRP